MLRCGLPRSRSVPFEFGAVSACTASMRRPNTNPLGDLGLVRYEVTFVAIELRRVDAYCRSMRRRGYTIVSATAAELPLPPQRNRTSPRACTSPQACTTELRLAAWSSFRVSNAVMMSQTSVS